VQDLSHRSTAPFQLTVIGHRIRLVDGCTTAVATDSVCVTQVTLGWTGTPLNVLKVSEINKKQQNFIYKQLRSFDIDALVAYK